MKRGKILSAIVNVLFNNVGNQSLKNVEDFVAGVTLAKQIDGKL